MRAELSRIAELVGSLRPEFGEPRPYFAILAADGDDMGQAISKLAKLDDPAAHRAFSLAQTQFADAARQLVNSPWRREATPLQAEAMHGAMVFAGADDVLAFAPLDQCLTLARKLRDLFGSSLRGALQAAGHEKAIEHFDQKQAFPPLSVGIAIGHFLEPFEDPLENARAAERRAKKPSPEEENRGQSRRNSLAIAVHSRGGAPFTVRDNWWDETEGSIPMSLDGRVLLWADIHRRRQVPAKAAYDLREVARDYPRTWTNEEQLAQAIQRDALRVFARKRAGSRDGGAVRRERWQGLIAGVRHAPGLLAVAQELLVGQWIAESLKHAGPPLLAAPLAPEVSSR